MFCRSVDAPIKLALFDDRFDKTLSILASMLQDTKVITLNFKKIFYIFADNFKNHAYESFIILKGMQENIYYIHL